MDSYTEFGNATVVIDAAGMTPALTAFNGTGGSACKQLELISVSPVVAWHAGLPNAADRRAYRVRSAHHASVLRSRGPETPR
jgi:hypothetical protein